MRMQTKQFACLTTVMAGLLACAALAADKPFNPFDIRAPKPSTPTPSAEKAADNPVQFVVALAKGNDGKIWVGTEGQGVFQHDPVIGVWRQFTTKDGLGDNNAYAVADRKSTRLNSSHVSESRMP